MPLSASLTPALGQVGQLVRGTLHIERTARVAAWASVVAPATCRSVTASGVESPVEATLAGLLPLRLFRVWVYFPFLVFFLVVGGRAQLLVTIGSSCELAHVSCDVQKRALGCK